GRAPGRSPFAAFRSGHAANVADAQAAARWIKPRARLTASKGAGYLDTVSEAAKQGAAGVRTAAKWAEPRAAKMAATGAGYLDHASSGARKAAEVLRRG